MDKTTQLIKALAESAEPVKRSASPLGIFLRWLAFSIVCEIMLVLVFGLRHDLADKLSQPTYIAELALLSAIVITSGLSAIQLSFPDNYQSKWPIFLPLIPFAGFAALLFYMWQTEPAVILPAKNHGIECLVCITMFSLFSTIAIMYFLKKQAVTHYYAAGAVAFLASSSLGALVFGLCEPMDSAAHLITWHYLPLLGFMALGMVVGRKFIRL